MCRVDLHHGTALTDGSHQGKRDSDRTFASGKVQYYLSSDSDSRAYAVADNPASKAETMVFTSLSSMTSGGERMILLPETRSMTPSL